MKSSIHMYHSEIKQKAIDLRKQGYSYNHILKHVPVIKSTLSEWLHEIPFTPNKYTLETVRKAHLASGVYKHQIRVRSLEKAELESHRNIQSLSQRDIMMVGLGLYIGEGGKTHGITRVINSDPKVIKFAIKWLKITFGVKLRQIKIRLFVYPDNKEKECISYWSRQTGVPKEQFLKSMVDLRTNKKANNKGKLPFGTAHMSVVGLGNKDHGVYLHRLIMALINKVL